MKLAEIKSFWNEKFSESWKRSNSRKILVLIIYFAIMMILVFNNSIKQIKLEPDEVAKRTIQSNVTVKIVDEQQTEELRKQAEESVQKSFQEDKEALNKAQNEIVSIYAQIDTIMSMETSEQFAKFDKLLASLQIEESQLDDTEIKNLSIYIQQVFPGEREQIQIILNNALAKIMRNPIKEEALPQARSELEQEITKGGLSLSGEKFALLLGGKVIKPNLIYDAVATEKAKEQARLSIEPVQKTIKTGETIVRAGERVTAEQISILEQLGIQRTQKYPLTLMGLTAFMLISTALLLKFIKKYHLVVFNNERKLFLVGLIIVMVLLLTRIMMGIKISDRPEINILTGYMAPIAAGSMLIAILLNTRLAYFITMVMALYVGMINEGNQLNFAIVAFIGGMVGVYRVSKFSQTSDLAKSGLYIAAINMVTILSLSIMDGNSSIRMSLVSLSMGAVNGIFSAIIMIGLLPYLESAFSITSMMKLLELSNPNNPLLKQLLIEAPGTYHHSLMVGNLAEATAESVGANSLLVRVGAYYHDIGKIKRPDYYVENQRGNNNPHEKIAPALSALIITSHVREGIEIAKEAHLPQDIIDFIAEHHGTSLTKYFYNQAILEDGEKNTNEENFRYEGPKPHNKEVALVMLADSVEAAVRSLTAPTLDDINDMVHKIIKGNLNDGQLDECNLTFKDLDVIARKFCNILEGVYHKRIEYPDSIAEELNQRRG